MKVNAYQLNTCERLQFDTLEAFCQKLSVPQEMLQEDYTHLPFENGIYKRYRCGWWRVDVLETIEELLAAIKQPIQTIIYQEGRPTWRK